MLPGQARRPALGVQARLPPPPGLTTSCAQWGTAHWLRKDKRELSARGPPADFFPGPTPGPTPVGCLWPDSYLGAPLKINAGS